MTSDVRRENIAKLFSNSLQEKVPFQVDDTMHVILHIGIHKTGTSAIQQSLGRARAYLRLFGYIYPVFFDLKGLPIYNHSRICTSLVRENSHEIRQNQIRGVDTPERAAEQQQYFLKQFRKYFQKSGTLVLSGEGMCTFTEDEWRRFRKLLEDNGATSFTVVTVLRDHQGFFNSSLQQYVKAGWTLDAAIESAKKGTKDLFRKRVSSARLVFPDAKFQVLSFAEARSSSEGLIKFFIKQVLPQVVWWPFRSITANETISAEAIEVVSYLNGAYPRIVNGRKSNKRSIGDVNRIYSLQGAPLKIRLEDAESGTSDVEWAAQEFNITGVSFTPLQKETVACFDKSHAEQLVSISSRLKPHLGLAVLDFIEQYIIPSLIESAEVLDQVARARAKITRDQGV